MQWSEGLGAQALKEVLLSIQAKINMIVGMSECEDSFGDFEGVEFEEKHISIKTSRYAWGETDYSTVTIEYEIFDLPLEQIRAHFKKIYAEAKEKEKIRLEQKAIKEKNDKEEKDLAEFERLKKKFANK